MMKVLCWDNPECNNLFVLEVCAAYYDDDINGLLLTPACGSFDDFCFPDLSLASCNRIISELYSMGQSDLRRLGEIQMYSDIVAESSLNEFLLKE